MNILTRPEAEKWLGVAVEQDSFIAQLIETISARIAQHCGRKDWGPVESRTEYKDGGGHILLLDVWPVVEVVSVHDDPLHDWLPGTELDASSYYSDEEGVIWYEHGAFLAG
ncbi:MAG: hypothetical protein EOM24_25260, partial [Chloroflexia bacterium]|nr:hypothetical protein [Chloroflexia bacterium]